MAGKGGGAWKVAYADFVTAMMAFFMVMWITAQGKPVKEAIAQYFKDPTGHATPREGASSTTPSEKTGIAPPGDESMPTGSPIGIPGEEGTGRKKGKGKGDGTKKQLVTRPRDGELMVGTSVVFAEHSADLSDAAKEQLQKVVPTLVGKRNKIELRAHSTRRPLPQGSPFRDAWQLCYARSAAVMKFLEEHGVEPERFRLSEAGPYEPAYTLGIDPIKQAANSRVDIYQLAVFVDDPAGGKTPRNARPGGESKH